MLLGYAAQHDENTYQIYKPSTKHVILSRDVLWLKRLFFNKEGKTEHISDKDIFDIKVEELPDIHPEEMLSNPLVTTTTTSSTPAATLTSVESPKRMTTRSQVNRGMNWFQSPEYKNLPKSV